jgi:hypothetical protein
MGGSYMCVCVCVCVCVHVCGKLRIEKTVHDEDMDAGLNLYLGPMH